MLLNFVAAFWAWFIFGKELSSERATGILFVRLVYAAAILIPPLFFHFACSLIREINNRLVLFFYLVSLIFLVLDFTPLFIKDVRPILSFRHYGIPGPIFPFFVISFISIIGYSHHILLKYFRKSEGQKNKIRYLLFATLIGFGGVSTFKFQS
jgi:hypothetical protein